MPYHPRLIVLDSSKLSSYSTPTASVVLLLCRRHRLAGILIPHIDLLPRLGHSIPPCVKLLRQQIELASFQDTRLDPGDVGGRGDLIEASADEMEAVRESARIDKNDPSHCTVDQAGRLTFRLPEHGVEGERKTLDPPKCLHHQMLNLIHRQPRSLGNRLKSHQL